MHVEAQGDHYSCNAGLMHVGIKSQYSKRGRRSVEFLSRGHNTSERVERDTPAGSAVPAGGIAHGRNLGTGLNLALEFSFEIAAAVVALIVSPPRPLRFTPLPRGIATPGSK